MAYTDKTRFGEYSQKKGVCLFVGDVEVGSADENIAATTGNYLHAKLPPDAIITNAYVHVVTPSDAATSAAMKLGTTEGGTQILSAADLKVAGKTGTFTGQSLTGTGKDLFVGVTVTGAATEVGRYLVVVEYVEYEKNTGEYTVTSR